MRKSRYYIANFPSCEYKNALAKLSRHVLEKIEYFLTLLQKFPDESNEQSPRRILYYMMRKNENIFNPGVYGISTYASTSCEEMSSEEPSSPVKGEPSSPIFPRKQLPFGVSKDSSESANLETKTTIDGNQQSVESCEKAKMVSCSAEDDKLKNNPKEERNLIEESEENIQALMKRNLVKITSMSIIRQLEDVGVEIDIDVISKPNDSSAELEQDSGALEKTKSPGRAEKQSKSPCSSPSKLGKSIRRPFVPDEAPLTVDFSNREVLEFIAKRLSCILSYRKKYMKRIYNFFLELQSDAHNFYNTIDNIKFVVKCLPMANEKFFTEDLGKMCSNLINKADEMLMKMRPMMQELDEDVDVWEECVQQLYNFYEQYGLPLFETNEAVLDVVVLKNLESLFKSIFYKADRTVFLKDGRKAILLKSSSDFECLIKTFFKFLIIAEILTPLECMKT